MVGNLRKGIKESVVLNNGEGSLKIEISIRKLD